MPEWSDTALILSIRPHGENAAVVSVLTQEQGRQAGLVRGGQSRSMRGVLQPGNLVSVRWRARLEEHLGAMVIELMAAHASLIMDDSLRLAGLTSICAIVEACLPEREPCPGIHEATYALVDMISKNDEHLLWLAGLVRWEIAMLEVAGYALDLKRCGVTGEQSGLSYVSPRTGVAVTKAGAGAHAARLLALPEFLGGKDAAGDEKTIEQDLLDGMELTRHFLERKVFAVNHQPLPPPRQRLDMLARQRLQPTPPEETAVEGSTE
jgi:DNA repair protein RecO (recombination protein O)